MNFTCNIRLTESCKKQGCHFTQVKLVLPSPPG